MKVVLRLSTLVFLLFCLQSCATTIPIQGPVNPGTYQMESDMDTNGFSRKSLVHIPAGYDPAQQWPLLIVLHGAFSTGREMADETGFNDLADREGFIVLYPEGIGILGFLQHWNAGHCCGKAADDGIDDMGFLDTVIERAVRRFSVDETQIFLAGHSNGGMLAFRYAALHPERLAGMAAVSAAINSKTEDMSAFPVLPAPHRPLPVCIIHGIEDDYIPFTEEKKSGRHKDRDFSSVGEAIDYWIRANGCENTPVHTIQHNGYVKQSEWLNCSGDAPVVLYAIENWGHDWPGREQISAAGPEAGDDGFDAAETIWNFFQSRKKRL